MSTQVWNAAGRFSEVVHREDRIAKLNARISEIGTRCGNCYKWMKSSECPKERNVNGRNAGPSAQEFKCQAFLEDPMASRLREQLKIELAGESQ